MGINEFFIANIDFTSYFNNWTHISGTWDGDEAKLYFNGILVGNVISNDFDSLLITGNHNFNIGARYTGTNHLLGLLPDFSIWNTALTQSEIQQYMSSPPTGN